MARIQTGGAVMLIAALKTTSAAVAASSVTISDGLIILATIAGPILAVQAQKWVERARRTGDMRTWVFTTLMNTRATRMSNAHIDALNTITIAFNDGGRRWRSKKCDAVIRKWREYLTHLSQPLPDNEAELAAQMARGTEIFTNLIEALAAERGFDVDRAEIVAGAYHPRGFVHGEQQRNEAFDRVLEILRGEKGLRVQVVPEIETRDDPSNVGGQNQ